MGLRMTESNVDFLSTADEQERNRRCKNCSESSDDDDDD